MNEELISLIGTAEAKLRRIKDKSRKSEILSMVQGENLAPEQRLRAFLAVGRTPPATLLSEKIISNALQISDRIAFLALLSRKASTVYADEVLDSILTYLVKFRSARTEGIAIGLDRITTRWFVAKKTLKIAPSTAYRLVAIVEALNKPLVSGGERRKNKLSRSQKSLKTLTRLAILLGSYSDDLENILQTLNVLISVEENLGAESAQTDDPEYDSATQFLLSSAHARLEELAEAGDDRTLERLAHALKRAPNDSQRLKSELERLFGIRARYQNNVQALLTKLVGLPEVEVSTSFELSSNDADALHVTQLASALVRAWSAREEGPKAKESFEELRVVLADFFGIEIVGAVGSVESFNSRVHEFPLGERSASRIRLIRPWVQISGSQPTRILIKALVVAAS